MRFVWINCRQLNWDTVSQPENEHLETQNSTKFARKLPNFGHFSYSKIPPKY